MGRSAPVRYGTGGGAGGRVGPRPWVSAVGAGRYADMGRCILIDCRSPMASHTANMEEPP